ncbi:hypothetical protein J2Y67_005535 [Neobacillus niacini]|nr:hypothetical protein [Neobacillus niacini]
MNLPDMILYNGKITTDLLLLLKLSARRTQRV